jgi:hypothetical protein
MSIVVANMLQGIRFSNSTPGRPQHLTVISDFYLANHWTSTPCNLKSIMCSLAPEPPKLQHGILASYSPLRASACAVPHDCHSGAFDPQTQEHSASAYFISEHYLEAYYHYDSSSLCCNWLSLG